MTGRPGPTRVAILKPTQRQTGSQCSSCSTSSTGATGALVLPVLL